MENSRIIICGSGNSIPFDNKKGLEPKLKEIIEREYSIGLNLWFKYGCETTINTWCDWQFYRHNLEDLKKLPLLVGKYDPQLVGNHLLQPNTITLPYCSKYRGNDSWSPNFEVGVNVWEKGFYSPTLSGLFALTLAICLGFHEIYLLGYDCNEINGKTHFYQDLIDLSDKRKGDTELVHYGVGKRTFKNKDVYNTGAYNDDSEKFKNRWKPFEQELKDIKIINVSPDSRISGFPKLTYEQFYAILNKDTKSIDQDKARDKIRDIIELKSNEAKNI